MSLLLALQGGGPPEGDGQSSGTSTVTGVGAAVWNGQAQAAGIGAADVVPLVPLEREAEPRARVAALALADRVADELGLPVFFYGRLTEDGREPAFFRRGGPRELQRRVDSGEVRPDRGPDRLHPTAGGVLVGVRRPLVAFNVNLRSDDLEAAREISRAMRASGIRCEAVSFYLANGKEAGQEVFHVHLHLIPRWRGDGLGLRVRPDRGRVADRKELDDVAAKIRVAIPRSVG